MAATLKLTHKAIGFEVRCGTYEVVVDGKPAGSVDMDETIDIPVEPGRHTLRLRNGRNSSRTKTFDADDGEIVAFRCTGKSILRSFSCPSSCPIWRSRSIANERGSRIGLPPAGPEALVHRFF